LLPEGVSPPVEGSVGAAKLEDEEETAKVAKMMDELVGIFILYGARKLR
jgi:hypothetical protein